MAESIFTSETPLAGNVSDATQYTLGTTWTSAVDGTVTHIRVYAPTGTPGANFVGVLYSISGESTGTELARATFGALTPAAWNTVELPGGGVSVTAGAHYVACYVTPDLFVLTTFVFTSAGITNGNLTAIQSGSPFGNGRIHVGDGFPEIASGQQSNYFADVVFEEGGAPVAAEGVGHGAGTGSAAGTKTAPASGVGHCAATVQVEGGKSAPGAGPGFGTVTGAAASTKAAAAGGAGHGGALLTAAGGKVAASAGALFAAAFGISGAAAPAARGPVVVTATAGPRAAVRTRTTTTRLEVSAR